MYSHSMCFRLPIFKQDKCFYATIPDKVKPVKFTTSPAANWRAEYSRSGDKDSPEAQVYIVVFSTAAFLYYFLIFREENDIDEELNISIYNKIEGLEESQLKVLYSYNLDRGIDNTAVVNRLRELEVLKPKT